MSQLDRRTISAASRFAVLGLGLLFLGGCENRVQVSGKVLNKGKPIPKAELRLVSEDGSLFASGATNEHGVYVIDTGGQEGISPAKYTVTVVWWLTNDGKALPAGEEGEAMKTTPKVRQFTATFTKELMASNSSLDFEVTDGEISSSLGGE